MMPSQLYALTKSESRIFKTESESTLVCNHCQVLERLKPEILKHVVHLNDKLEKWAVVHAMYWNMILLNCREAFSFESLILM